MGIRIAVEKFYLLQAKVQDGKTYLPQRLKSLGREIPLHRNRKESAC